MMRSNDGANMAIYKDSASIGTDTGGGNVDFSTGTEKFVVGGDINGFGNINADIAEMIFFDNDLTAAERAKVDRYLSYKYNISIDAENYGIDTLTGGSGADTFIWSNNSYSKGSYIDQIDDFSGTIGDGDKIDISDITSNFIYKSSATFSGTANEFIVYQGTGGDSSHSFIAFDIGGDGSSTSNAEYVIQLNNYTAANLDVAEDIIFSSSSARGTSGNDTLTTGGSGQAAQGFAGNDLITGGIGADNLFGGTGNDTIIGGYSGDSLVGGTGNDVIYADSTTFANSTVADMELWLDANNLNGDGTTGSDGSAVSTWEDLSGNNRDATQGTSNYQPIVKLDQINGHAVVRLDNNTVGQEDWLGGSAALSAGDDSYTYVAIWKSTDPDLASVFEHNNSSTSPGTRGALLTINATEYGYNGEGNDAHDIGTYANNVWQFSILERLDQDNNNVLLHEAGDPVAGTINNTTANLGVSGGYNIGRKIPTNSEFLGGDVAEIMVFSDNLTTAERDAVHAYLSNKYNLSLAGYSYGVDTLTGGTGADIFSYSGNSISNTSNVDIITDYNQSANGTYSAGEGDIVRMEYDQQLQLNATNAFTGVQNELIWRDDGSGGVYIEIDWGADSFADFRLQLQDNGTADFSQSDITSASFQFKNVIGTTGADTLNGTDGADTLDGSTGLDSLVGGSGNDVLIYEASDLASGGLVDGGDDTDTWQVDSAVTITITSSSTWDYVENIEYIDLVSGNYNSTLSISAEGLSNITDNDNDLYVQGDGNDTIISADSWTDNGSTVVDSVNYNHYTSSGYNLYIEDVIEQTLFTE